MTRVELPTERKAMYAIKHGKLIGEGSYRAVYRTGRARWAYKFNTTGACIGSNDTEWRTYSKMSKKPLPEGVKLPEMHLLPGGIIATEYIKGDHPVNECYKDYHITEATEWYPEESLCPGKDKCWAEKIKNVAVSDLHNENVLIAKDGTVYIIDLGHGNS